LGAGVGAWTPRRCKIWWRIWVPEALVVGGEEDDTMLLMTQCCCCQERETLCSYTFLIHQRAFVISLWGGGQEGSTNWEHALRLVCETKNKLFVFSSMINNEKKHLQKGPRGRKTSRSISLWWPFAGEKAWVRKRQKRGQETKTNVY